MATLDSTRPLAVSASANVKLWRCWLRPVLETWHRLRDGGPEAILYRSRRIVGTPMASKNKQRAAFGDFQTPGELATAVCATTRRVLPVPRSVIEPTCGVGNILVAAAQAYPAARLLGIETNAEYLRDATEALAARGATADLLHHDFFGVDWDEVLQSLPAPTLVVGNPPWVTNSELGSLASTNLPPKRNDRGLSGLDALTGKSNFDISEWMCIRLLEALAHKEASLALLLKTTVVRKVLAHAWTHGFPLRDPCIFEIDAQAFFGASVDACLFVAQIAETTDRRCPVFADLEGKRGIGTIAWEDGQLLANADARRRTAELTASKDDRPLWRSGLKHDSAKVLELRPHSDGLVNGLGEVVDVEPDSLFPLQKSSDVAGDRGDLGKRVIVTQRGVGQPTDPLEQTAPRLWAYLCQHGAALDARKSSIYRGKPRFSIFGVGDYTFAPWKVAVSGLYKRLEFRLVGPVNGAPVIFDDTVYFLPFDREEDAAAAHRLLRSELARTFFDAFIFWDAKRPITAGVLRRLSLQRLGQALGSADPPSG